MMQKLDIDNKQTQLKLAQRFITNLIELGGQFVVNNDTGMIAYADRPNDPILLKTKDKFGKVSERTLVVYQYHCPIENALMVNPFVEQVYDNSTERLWFYSITNRCHTVVFSHIVEYIIASAVKAAKGEKLDNPDLLKLLALIVGEFDAKSEKELASIIKKIPEYDGSLDDEVIAESNRILNASNTRDFISIVRNIKDKKASLVSFLQDDEGAFKKKFGNRVRKKTFALIENIFKTLYRVDDVTVPLIEHESGSLHSASFISYAKVIIESWNRFLPYISYIWDENMVDKIVSKLVQLEEILPHIDKIAASSVYARTNVSGDIHYSDGTVDRTLNVQKTSSKKDVQQQMIDKVKQSKNVYIDDQQEYSDNLVTNEQGYSSRSYAELRREQANDYDDSERSRHDDKYRSRDRYHRDRDPRYDDRYGDDRRDRYDRSSVRIAGQDRYDRYDRYRDDRDDRYDRYPRDRYRDSHDRYHDRYREREYNNKSTYLGRGYNPGSRLT